MQSAPRAVRVPQSPLHASRKSRPHYESSRAGVQSRSSYGYASGSPKPPGTKRSDSVSSAEVASSRIRIGGFFRMARAILIRWRCPPDNLPPRSPILVSYPSSLAMIKSWRIGDTGRLLDLFECSPFHSERDIIEKCVVKKNRLLVDIPHQAAQIVQGRITHIRSVDRYAPLVHIIETRQQIHQRALSRPRLADQRYRVSFRNRQVNAFQHPFMLVLEPDIPGSKYFPSEQSVSDPQDR